eukprot:14456946-Ditylum_brightwellii.AAC.1
MDCTGQIETAISSGSAQYSVLSQQRKRKRRNIRIAGGGMITLQDMEAIAKESRKRSMSVSSSTGMNTNDHIEQEANDIHACVKDSTQNEAAQVETQSTSKSSFYEELPAVRSTLPTGILRKRRREGEKGRFGKVDESDRCVTSKTVFPGEKRKEQMSCRGQNNKTRNSELSKGENSLKPHSPVNSAEPFVPSAQQIHAKVSDLFGPDVLKKPCASARLFASISLMLENDQTAMKLTDPFQGPLLPLLKRLVDAELSSLSKSTIHLPCDGDSPPSRKIQFCSFDYSSTMPPVDIQVGSNEHVESCILSLHKVAREIDWIRTECNSTFENEMKSTFKEN